MNHSPREKYPHKKCIEIGNFMNVLDLKEDNTFL
jgi:hypothetical protein